MINNRLISFEGPEGCGKSTQIEILCKKLKDRGEDVLSVREPGGTDLGESIRKIVQSNSLSDLSDNAELLLFMSSRAQLVNQLILPALNNGKWVLCDRFIDSSVAYQGYARGGDINFIKSLNEYATQGLAPSTTFFLDLDLDICLERLNNRCSITNYEKDRIEMESSEFHNQVINGYRRLAKEEKRFFRIDANQNKEYIADQIFNFLKR